MAGGGRVEGESDGFGVGGADAQGVELCWVDEAGVGGRRAGGCGVDGEVGFAVGEGVVEACAEDGRGGVEVLGDFFEAPGAVATLEGGGLPESCPEFGVVASGEGDAAGVVFGDDAGEVDGLSCGASFGLRDVCGAVLSVGLAAVCEGAEEASRCLWGADGGAEFHEGFVGEARVVCCLGEGLCVGPCPLDGVWVVGGCVACGEACEDACDVAVDDGGGFAEGDAGDGAGGVAADAREFEEFIDFCGDAALEGVDDGFGGGVE